MSPNSTPAWIVSEPFDGRFIFNHTMNKPTQSEYPSTENVICEMLVREINYAQTWSAIESAWNALLHVRGMSAELRKEHEHRVLNRTGRQETQIDGGSQAP